MNINCILFNDFETLDLFGPVEVFGKIDDCCINYYSINGGETINSDNIKIITENIFGSFNISLLQFHYLM